MTQEASTNQQYINVSMFRVSVPRRARIDLTFQSNFFKPNTRTEVQGIPVLGYFFLVHCTRINLCCSNFPL